MSGKSNENDGTTSNETKRKIRKIHESETMSTSIAAQALISTPHPQNFAERQLVLLLCRGDGYLKIVPALNSRAHFYWKFTKGVWKGCYAYWTTEAEDLFSEGLAGLADKLGDIDAGVRKPCKDTQKDSYIDMMFTRRD